MRKMNLVAFVAVTAISASAVPASAATGREVLQQTRARAGKAIKFGLTSVKRVLEVGLYSTAATAGAYGLTLGAGAAVSFWSGDGGTAFHTAMNTANNVLLRAKDVAIASAHYAPAAGIAMGVAGAGYIAKPGAVYLVQQGGKIWQKGGIKADVVFGGINAAAALALGGDPVTVGYTSQLASMGARAAVSGLEAVATRKVEKTRW